MDIKEDFHRNRFVEGLFSQPQENATEIFAKSQTSKQNHNLKSKRYNYADVLQPNMHTCIFIGYLTRTKDHLT